MRDTKGIVNVWTRLKFCILKESANGCNIVGQQLRMYIVGSKMLHIASVCTPCCMLLRVVGSCCVLLGVVAQSLKPPVKLLAPWKGTQDCWELLRPLSRTIVALSVLKNWVFYRTDYGVKVNSHYWFGPEWAEIRASYPHSSLFSIINAERKIKRDFLKEKN